MKIKKKTQIRYTYDGSQSRFEGSIRPFLLFKKCEDVCCGYSLRLLALAYIDLSEEISAKGSMLLHRNSTVARRVTNVTSEHHGDP